MKSGQHGISNHSIKTNRVDGAQTRQKSRLGSSNVQIQKTSQNMKGLMEVKLTR